MAIFSKNREHKPKSVNRISAMILELMNAVCAEETEVVLVWHELMHMGKATFAEIEEDSLALANPTNIKPSLLDPSLPVTLIFSHLGRIFTFTSWFVLYSEGGMDPETGEDTPPLLILQVPWRIAATDSRTSAKIKITPQTPFRIECLLGENQGIPARATEISLTGILLTLEEDPDFKVDSKVILKMGMEEEVEVDEGDEEDQVLGEEPGPGEEREKITKMIWKPLKVEAVVRSKESGRYGFYFPVCLSPEGIKPPAPLRELVHEVERNYLQQRAELEMEKEEEERE